MSKAQPDQKGRLREVLDYLRDHPGATQLQITQALGMTSRSHLQKCLDLAQVNGLVHRSGSQRQGGRRYELTEGPPALSRPGANPPSL